MSKKIHILISVSIVFILTYCDRKMSGGRSRDTTATEKPVLNPADTFSKNTAPIIVPLSSSDNAGAWNDFWNAETPADTNCQAAVKELQTKMQAAKYVISQQQQVIKQLQKNQGKTKIKGGTQIIESEFHSDSGRITIQSGNKKTTTEAPAHQQNGILMRQLILPGIVFAIIFYILGFITGRIRKKTNAG